MEQTTSFTNLDMAIWIRNSGMELDDDMRVLVKYVLNGPSSTITLAQEKCLAEHCQRAQEILTNRPDGDDRNSSA